MTNQAIRDKSKLDLENGNGKTAIMNLFIPGLLILLASLVVVILSPILLFIWPGLGMGFLIVFQVGLVLVSLLLMQGLIFGYLDMVRGKKLETEDLLRSIRSDKVGRNILTGIARPIVVSLEYLLFIIPGVILSFAYMPVEFVMKDNPDLDALEILTKSRKMMKNNKWNYFKLIAPYIIKIILMQILVFLISSLIIGFLSEGLGALILIVGTIIVFIIQIKFIIEMYTASANYYDNILIYQVMED